MSQGSSSSYAVIVSGWLKSCDSTMEPGRTALRHSPRQLHPGVDRRPGKGGLYNNVVRMGPPLTLTAEEAREGLAILTAAIATAAAETAGIA